MVKQILPFREDDYFQYLFYSIKTNKNRKLMRCFFTKNFPITLNHYFNWEKSKKKWKNFRKKPSSTHYKQPSQTTDYQHFKTKQTFSIQKLNFIFFLNQKSLT